MFCIAKGH